LPAITETMNFQQDLNEHIAILEQLPDFNSDIALRRVVEILKEVKNEKELRKQEGLISRIAIDSIEDWDTINLISAFLKSHTK
jgi:hypothetical protein